MSAPSSSSRTMLTFSRSRMSLLNSSRWSFTTTPSFIENVYNLLFIYSLFYKNFFRYNSSFDHNLDADFSFATSLNTSSERCRIIMLFFLGHWIFFIIKSTIKPLLNQNCSRL
ncbi:hypothetical protein CISIN_1g033721mg [Citrus sinensis]|uniref:Uncharacterized protein n=1 Tax=Citrus sinensis TaxID=2711 RepID=A0A067D6L1_CITSI|nr:hypothetical protein CISIN_1g033721mg [Citrus sinensis]